MGVEDDMLARKFEAIPTDEWRARCSQALDVGSVLALGE